MIKNEKQYGISKNEVKKFKAAIQLIREDNSGKTHPVLIKAQIDSINSQVIELEDEIKVFEDLKSGAITFIPMNIKDLSNGIIESRIAKGYSHRKLGELLGVKEQQIQKYESENYMNTSLKRVLDVISILNIDVRTNFNLKTDTNYKTPEFELPIGLDVDGIQDKINARGVTVEICHS